MVFKAFFVGLSYLLFFFLFSKNIPEAGDLKGIYFLLASLFAEACRIDSCFLYYYYFVRYIEIYKQMVLVIPLRIVKGSKFAFI